LLPLFGQQIRLRAQWHRGLSDRAGILRVMPRIAHFDQAKLAATLQKQHGIISRHQASSCLMTDKAIRYRLRVDGPWHVVLPGIYADGRGALSDSQRAVAAFLYAGRGIAVTGLAAVAWHGVKVNRSELVDVLVPPHHQRCDAGFARLHRTSVQLGAICQDGVVVYAPLDRAIIDAARQLTDLSEIRALVASAVQAGKLMVGHLARELERTGPVAGSARVRLVLAEVADGVRSAAEADLRTLIIQARLPTPLYNPDLYVGDAFLARPDAWWPDAGVAVEVDSMAWHLSPADYERTQLRHDRMVAQGIRVLHFAPRYLRVAKRDVVQQIKSTLAQSTGPLLHIETRPAR
jgi:very-short-patch-repair endonuclease